MILLSTILILQSVFLSSSLINLDWQKIEQDVTLRYFSPKRFSSSENPEEIWNGMGQNITCNIQDEGQVSVTVPDDFDSNIRIKALAHGFTDTVKDDKALFVDAWMSHFNKDVSVILVDWHNLASAFYFESLNDYVYDHAARNAIDVGEFLGLCLAELKKSHDVTGSNIHLVGHSLGAHLVGKAGRTFTKETSEKIGRITGLDPAGPRFVDGPLVSAIPELAANVLNKDYASLVDVIHTNGAIKACIFCTAQRAGALRQLGHMDFYPDGGSVQRGCLFGIDARPGGSCSHGRSVKYFYHSIREPKLFPSKPCESVEECNDEKTTSNNIEAYLGEQASDYYDAGEQAADSNLYYHDVNNCHWTFKEHNNFGCFRRDDEDEVEAEDEDEDEAEAEEEEEEDDR